MGGDLFHLSDTRGLMPPKLHEGWPMGKVHLPESDVGIRRARVAPADLYL